jgi:hypothetical protein
MTAREMITVAPYQTIHVCPACTAGVLNAVPLWTAAKRAVKSKQEAEALGIDTSHEAKEEREAAEALRRALGE